MKDQSAMFKLGARPVPQGYNPYQLANWPCWYPLYVPWGISVPVNGALVYLPKDTFLQDKYIVGICIENNYTTAPGQLTLSVPLVATLNLQNDALVWMEDYPLGQLTNLSGGSFGLNQNQIYPSKIDLEKSFVRVLDNTNIVAASFLGLYFWYIPEDLLPCELATGPNNR